MAERFLDTIAQAYIENFDDLSDFCFVFPNKRAGTFFRRALSQQLGPRVMLAPEIASISDFVEKLSGLETASRIDQLFRLFNIYRSNKNLLPANGKSDDILEFDSFRSWGEILLSDFSEVDQYAVDASALFANVSDYREISSNFLTDEQLEVLERYFGYKPSIDEVERFWKSYAHASDSKEIKQRFIYLWQSMATLYDALNENLESDGLATQGRIYLKALENVREKGRELTDYRKIVFVGFNALSTTEALLFEALRKAGGYYADEKEAFVDFYWDATGPVLESEESEASLFLRLNRRNFPSPEWAQRWLDLNRKPDMPDKIRVIASPSNAAQTKIAVKSLYDIFRWNVTDEESEGDIAEGEETAYGTDAEDYEEIKEEDVAIVLPDENLLLPMLYALPHELKNVNLTMGYPLRLTSLASFLHHLRMLHTRSHVSADDVTFFHEDVKALLSHPFTHALLGSGTVASINSEIVRTHQFQVSLKWFQNKAGGIGAFPLDVKEFGGGTSGAIKYIDNVLVRVDEKLAGKNDGVIKSRIDRSHIATYRDALRRLEQSATEQKIEMGLGGVFYMVDKLLSGEHVGFEGEPLKGLQVMGLLETRALDFKHLIILSMNDQVMPRKARRATFIPDSLRRGYGLPYSNYQERLFSYYFYRMISRVDSVTLIYDARSGEGVRSGGESRYLTQLRYLYAKDRQPDYYKYQFLITDGRLSPVPLKKTPEMMAKIKEYAREGSGKNLSASSLRRYGECPIRFYYEVVEGIRTEDEDTEFINVITQGNVVHDTMLSIYFPEELQRKYLEKRIRITPEFLDDIINGKNRGKIKALVRRYINRHHYHKTDAELDTPLEGAALMIAEHLTEMVTDILRYDRNLAPFDLAGGEMADLLRWQYDDGKYVNMKFAIDRLDILHPDDANGGEWRIIDYKTGGSHIDAKSFEEIFNGTYNARNMLQLLLYANLLNQYTGEDRDVRVAIYSVGELTKTGETPAKICNKRLKSHKEINETFVETLNGMIRELMDPDKDFMPAQDEGNCKYCILRDLCTHQKEETEDKNFAE